MWSVWRATPTEQWQLSEVHVLAERVHVLRLRDCTEFGPALRHAELVHMAAIQLLFIWVG